MRLKTLRLEACERRELLTTVSQANPTYEAQEAYLDNLITPSMITDTAVASGNWSNPATWSNGVPLSGNVWVPNGITVTVDTTEPGSLHSILDNGLITFATNVDTSLLVNTIVVGTTDNATGLPEGEFDVGTVADPIQSGVTATVTFADDGVLSQAWPNDPAQLAGGLISSGTCSIVGSSVTPYATITGGYQAGSDTLTLASAPAGWNVGDTLLLPGASAASDQDEQITIAAIDGNTVTLSSPLQFNHGNAFGQPVYADDEARNVIFQSQNESDYERHGSIMFMLTDQQTVENADFLYLGRTDKSLLLGATNPDGTLNENGRFALHFCRDYWPGLTENDPPVLVSGNFEMGSPGWGYVNHSSNIDFEDNVAFDNNGSGFVTDAGNEIGTFNANMAVRSTSTDPVPTSWYDQNGNGETTENPSANTFRQQDNDFGSSGAGFWMQSPSCVLTNNIALDCDSGFEFYTQGQTTPAGLVAANGYIPTFSGQDVQSVPLAGFTGNSAGFSTDGVNLFNVGLDEGDNGTSSYIDQFTAYGDTIGVEVNLQTAYITVENSTLLGPGSNVAATYGIFTHQTESLAVNAVNDTVSGFSEGFVVPEQSPTTVTGGYWNDKVGIEVTPIYDLARATSPVNGSAVIDFPVFPIRTITLNDLTFGSSTVTPYELDSQTAYEGDNPNIDFAPDGLWINGIEQYFSDQGASFVPFPEADANMPAAFVGLTNEQLLAEFGLCMQGAIAGEAEPASYNMPVSGTTLGATYYISYVTTAGVTVREADPVTLVSGPNVITQDIEGVLQSFVVIFR